MTQNSSHSSIVDLLNRGKIVDALNLCQEEHKLQPYNLEIMVLMTKLLLSSNQYQRAIEFLIQNREKEGESCTLSNLLIEAWSNEEKFAEILEIYHNLPSKENLANSAKLCVGFAFQSLSDFARAIEIFKSLQKCDPSNFEIAIFLGNAYRYTGDQERAVESFNLCIQSNSKMKALAYFSLSNLKSYRFSDYEVDQMNAQLIQKSLSLNDKAFLLFALGKAYEDLENFEKSFEHYAKGNQIEHKNSRYDPKLHFNYAKVITNSFENKQQELIHRKDKNEVLEEGPIFILGMPRSGSTLVEQILSSHSKVERMGELPYIGQLIFELSKEKGAAFLQNIGTLTQQEIENIRQTYRRKIRVHRKKLLPMYIDKTPANFEHIGFIKTIFPEALIIDTRREIRANVFSIFKQKFFRGQEYSYSIENIQAYYSVYVYFMKKWTAIFENQIYKIEYENLVDDFRNEVRQLLEYCGLKEEDSCYRFFENKQVVETASSEQVRKPIYKSAKSAWSNYSKYFSDVHIISVD